ncbi:hypothetical protein ACFL45_11435 [Candidatus Neomarinimicrobiota bacterium]
MSDSIAARLSHVRWHSEPSHANSFVRIGSSTQINSHACAVTFTQEDFDSYQIDRQLLTPFILRESDRKTLASESVGNTSLERRPIIQFDNEWVVATPNAISPAIRLYLLTELRQLGHLPAFQKTLRKGQVDQVVQEAFFELKKDAVSLDPPEPEVKPKVDLTGWLLKYDTNKYLHLVFLPDQLDQIEEQGLDSYLKYSDEQRVSLTKYVEHISTYCKNQPDYSEGITIFILAGIGRGVGLWFDHWPDDWQFSVINIPDLLMLAAEINRPINRFLKCIKQKTWAEKAGVQFRNLSGDMNLYRYWQESGYRMIPKEAPIGPHTTLSIGSDIIFSWRQNMRTLLDKHVVEIPGDQYLHVMRFGYDSYFEYLQTSPIYVSLDHLHAGRLAGVVEKDRGPSWLSVFDRDHKDQGNRTFYEMWSGLLGLFEQLVTELESASPTLSSGPVEIVLNFANLQVPDTPIESTSPSPPTDTEIRLDYEHNIAEVKFPSGFLRHFQTPQNVGEKLALASMAQGLLSIHTRKEIGINDDTIQGVLNSVLPTTGLRILHLFHTYNPVEYLLSNPTNRPVFIKQEDYLFNSLLLSTKCTKKDQESHIQGRDECNEFLHRVVDILWEEIKASLQSHDRKFVIRNALSIHESILQDRDHWKRTALAIFALHGQHEDVLAVNDRREKDRTDTALAVRILVEMAICECPVTGGKIISQWELDNLIAKIAQMLTAANDSDAVVNLLVDPFIQLYENGEYSIDRSAYESVVSQFREDYLRDSFEQAVKEYDQLYYDEPNERVQTEEIFRADYIDAFKAEYMMTLDEAIDGLAELMDIAVEQNSVVVETTMDDLRRRLLNKRGLTVDAYDSFIKTFGLFHRPKWEIAPNGFTGKDIFPWRFRRRLSVVVRPILFLGNEADDSVMYGLGGLKSGVSYLIQRAERGHLPGRFFSSVEMQRYIGKVNHEKGHDFGEAVAAEFRSRGWEIRTAVKMSEIGANPSLAAGDIDVLAWKSSGAVLIIECKRIQLARTVAEVAEICRRFRGDAEDELDKHMRRVTWIINEPSCLKHIIGFTPDQKMIDHRLITSTHVPMRYLKSLPIPADKIGPLN